MDGKVTAIDAWDSPYCQRNGSKGLLRTVTATLVSSSVRVCLDAFPIAAASNEMSTFQAALSSLLDAYRGLDLFRLVLYDSGACSKDNAAFTRSVGLHYGMILNGGQPTLFAEAQRVLGSLGEERAAEVLSSEGRTVRYLVWSTEELTGWPDWPHLRTVVRICRQVLAPNGQLRQSGERYFVTSLRRDALSSSGWAELLRARWGVENDCHHTFDAVFGEDEQPWFRCSAPGALAVLMLRRIAYNMAALFRGRTLRNGSNPLLPWRDLMRRTYLACVAATAETVAGLRLPRPAS